MSGRMLLCDLHVSPPEIALFKGHTLRVCVPLAGADGVAGARPQGREGGDAVSRCISVSTPPRFGTHWAEATVTLLLEGHRENAHWAVIIIVIILNCKMDIR